MLYTVFIQHKNIFCKFFQRGLLFSFISFIIRVYPIRGRKTPTEDQDND